MVQFVDEAGRDAALKLNKTLLHSMRISVLPSKFPAVLVDTSGRDDSMDISSHASMDDKINKEESPPAKVWVIPQVTSKGMAFKPRGLDLKTKAPTRPAKKLHVDAGSAMPESNDVAPPADAPQVDVSTSSKSLSNDDFRKFFN